MTTAHFVAGAQHWREVHDRVTKSLAMLPPAPVHVVWGGDLPYEAVYRPLESKHDMPSLRFYGLGASQLAPFALAYWKGSEAGFIEQLT